MYDLIGDIHGYATERKVIVLGDFVDRGPEQVETVEIAMKMVESGNALAVMGNHEFNAVAWATPDPKNPDEFLRPHTEKNLKQHRELLEQVGDGSELHNSFIDWFKTLPVYLNFPKLRVVHACWHPEHVRKIDKYTDDENRLLERSWEQSTRKDTEAFNAIETLLKGLELPIPEGHYFLDKEKNKRTDIRAEWWRTGNLTFHDLAMVPGSEIEKIPHASVGADILPGYDEKKPVFGGHYWMKGDPEPLSDHIACLDYSVAGAEAGKLCAYRFCGEAILCAERFSW